MIIVVLQVVLEVVQVGVEVVVVQDARQIRTVQHDGSGGLLPLREYSRCPLIRLLIR